MFEQRNSPGHLYYEYKVGSNLNKFEFKQNITTLESLIEEVYRLLNQICYIKFSYSTGNTLLKSK